MDLSNSINLLYALGTKLFFDTDPDANIVGEAKTHLDQAKIKKENPEVVELELCLAYGLWRGRQAIVTIQRVANELSETFTNETSHLIGAIEPQDIYCAGTLDRAVDIMINPFYGATVGYTDETEAVKHEQAKEDLIKELKGEGKVGISARFFGLLSEHLGDKLKKLEEDVEDFETREKMQYIAKQAEEYSPEGIYEKLRMTAYDLKETEFLTSADRFIFFQPYAEILNQLPFTPRQDSIYEMINRTGMFVEERRHEKDGGGVNCWKAELSSRLPTKARNK